MLSKGILQNSEKPFSIDLKPTDHPICPKNFRDRDGTIKFSQGSCNCYEDMTNTLQFIALNL